MTTMATRFCTCEAPLVRCDHRGCVCQSCLRPVGAEPCVPRFADLSEDEQVRAMGPGPGEGSRTGRWVSAASDDSDWVTDEARHAGRVVRYHTWVVHHHQTVGEHCWQVYRVYSEMFGQPSADVAWYIWQHDAAELVVGDPPYPVKMRSPVLRAEYDHLEGAALERMGLGPMPSIPDVERGRIKVADLLEMTEYGMTEREMGNLLAVPVVLRTARTAEEVARERGAPGDDELVRRHLGRLWERHARVLGGGGSAYVGTYQAPPTIRV